MLEMSSLLVFGFFIGMKHAIEADHLAAVASLAAHGHSKMDCFRQGAVWGLGHTLTLFVFGAAVILTETLVPKTLACILELGVGIMLIGLGVTVVRRLIRDHCYFHTQRHDNAVLPSKIQLSSRASGHDSTVYQHVHTRRFPFRALLVGLMHGMAGSAALMMLTLQTVNSPLAGLLYIGVFGFGSIAGMSLLSLIIAIPLRQSVEKLAWLRNGFEATIGIATIVIGVMLFYETSIENGLILPVV